MGFRISAHGPPPASSAPRRGVRLARGRHFTHPGPQGALEGSWLSGITTKVFFLDSGSTAALPVELTGPFPWGGLRKAVPAPEEEDGRVGSARQTGRNAGGTAAPEPRHAAGRKAAPVLQERSRSSGMRAEAWEGKTGAHGDTSRFATRLFQRRKSCFSSVPQFPRQREHRLSETLERSSQRAEATRSPPPLTRSLGSQADPSPGCDPPAPLPTRPGSGPKGEISVRSQSCFPREARHPIRPGIPLSFPQNPSVAWQERRGEQMAEDTELSPRCRNFKKRQFKRKSLAGASRGSSGVGISK